MCADYNKRVYGYGDGGQNIEIDDTAVLLVGRTQTCAGGNHDPTKQEQDDKIIGGGRKK